MDPVAEPTQPHADEREPEVPSSAEQALRAALEEQRMVAEFGQEALRGRPLAELVELSVEVVQAALAVEFAGVLEHLPEEGVLEMRAGRGWPESEDPMRFTDDPGTQVGAILASGEPLVVTDVLREDRVTFNQSTLALGIRSSIGVRILGPDRALGVIGALSTQPRTFSSDNAAFLQAIANVLGSAWALDRSADQRRMAQAALVLSADRERTRIATDLHDDTVQVMTATLLSLDRLVRSMREIDRPDLTAQAQTARETLSLAIDRTRNMMFELRPPLLDSSGLAVAVSELVRVLSAEEGFEGTTECRIERLPEVVESLAYRTLAELLSNVRRHASATRLHVSLTVEDGVLRGVVTDDGSGFDVRVALDRRTAPLHLGLDSTAERLRLSGGDLEIQSQPGAGTTVRLAIPLDYS
ncbi:MAG: two-component system, NarL family, sensor histidine kinase UhpB [Gaiellales bacterium]|jgi:signal transduction histidine kinase|nr:two-component system, NarL family, sensor histidine kinase UhpB [Gaiellales bacterium]